MLSISTTPKAPCLTAVELHDVRIDLRRLKNGPLPQAARTAESREEVAATGRLADAVSTAIAKRKKISGCNILRRRSSKDMARDEQESKGISALRRRGAHAVPHGTTHEDIYGQLKRAIMSASFVPGERLVVAKLAKVFGTSPMPIREALRRLVAEQALDNNPNRGVEVPTMTPVRLMDLKRVRCEIEGRAAEWAASAITALELDRLESVQARMCTMAKKGVARAYLDTNLEFHFTIYRAARSPLLIPIIESLWMQAGPCLNAMRSTATLGLGLDHHEDMVQALRRGDGRKARDALQRDISEAADIILQSLEDDEHSAETATRPAAKIPERR